MIATTGLGALFTYGAILANQGEYQTLLLAEFDVCRILFVGLLTFAAAFLASYVAARGRARREARCAADPAFAAKLDQRRNRNNVVMIVVAIVCFVLVALIGLSLL